MDYNDNEETIRNVVTTASLGTWRGDTRTCEKGQVIYGGCPVINNRSVNLNERSSNMDGQGNNQGSRSDGAGEDHAANATTTWGKMSPTRQRNDAIAQKMNLSSTETAQTQTQTASVPSHVNLNQSGQNQNQLMTWKDVSPTKSGTELEPPNHQKENSCNGLTNGGRRASGSKCDWAVMNGSGSLCRSGSGGANQCNANRRAGSQTELSQSTGSFHENGSPPGGEKGFNTSPDDMCNNEYFYDEDFTVQFDTNIRESSVTPSDSDRSSAIAAVLEFPNMVTGSYLSFNNMRGSSNLSINNLRGSALLRNDDRYQYDSEFSGSRNSTMEMSSSEREMMCSSDMIDLSDGPLFTPTPTHMLSTDSLDPGNRGREGGAPGAGQSQELSGSNISGEANLVVDCCPRKEAYFLSFDGSQTRVSGSETDCSLTSHDSGQGHWNNSESSTSRESLPCNCVPGAGDHHTSGEDGQEESSDSFHFCYTGSRLSPLHRQNHQYLGRENLAGRGLKKLLPVEELTQEGVASSEEDEEEDSAECCKTSPTLTAGSKELPSLSPYQSPKKRPFSKPLTDSLTRLKEANKSADQKGEKLFLVGIGKSSEIFKKGSSKSLPAKNLMSWKQMKGLKKIGRQEAAKSKSLPELSNSTSWQSISALKCRKISDISESFHNKRHSASLLEFYQRMKSESNPVSPEAMNNLEQILWPNFIGQKNRQGELSDSSASSVECTQCRCHHQQGLSTLTGSVTKAYTNKRIFDWLKMECSSSSRPTSLGCQTNRMHDYVSKETLISPQTVTLWCGTKNFGAQFPPLTKDSGVQTVFDANCVSDLRSYSSATKKDQCQQTSSYEDGEILSLLSENYDDFGFLRSNEGTAPREFQRPLCRPDLPASVDGVHSPKPRINRSKSVDECRHLQSNQSSQGSDYFNANVSCHQREGRSRNIGRSKSTGRLSSKSESPFRRMGFSSHYTHQSMPDLSFLTASLSVERDDSHESLFDPLKIDMPVPMFVTPKTELEKFEIYNKKSQCQCCVQHSQCAAPVPQCGETKTKSAVPRNVRQAESASSSSGFSTSSTSSGIDPGYCACDSRSSQNSSPHNDIERLIFYPPHTEVSKSGKKCCGTKKRAHSVPKGLSEYGKAPINVKFDRYAYEVHPQVSGQGSSGKTRLGQKWSGPSKPGSLDQESGGENLYCLEEEQTPVPSPEKQACCHGNSYRDCDHYAGNLQRAKQYNYDSSDFYRAVVNDQMTNVEHPYMREFSTDSASSSGSFAPNIDKKPLKSCLSKRNRAFRSRSMSDPFSLNLEELKRREKAKNRHSYACDEVYIVSDEFGQLMMYQADDSAEPVMFYLDKDGECHMTEGGKQLDALPGQDVSGSDSSTERDSGNKRKSVSFASEVSFQSISPTSSPKKQVTMATTDADVDETEATKMHPEEVPMETGSESDTDQEMASNHGDEGSSSGSETAPDIFPVATETDETEDVVDDELVVEKGYLMRVCHTADLLVAHFAKSVDTFDKLRLGDTAETPEIGDLVLHQLCPALSQVVGNGMKNHLVGFQMFGRVQVTVWKVVEASVELVPQTRAISDLVTQLKQTTFLSSHQQKFNAFVFGLLNLRLLDFWMGYIRQKEDLLAKFYEQDSLLVLGGATLRKSYDTMLLALQPLSVLPFQLNADFIKEVTEKSDASNSKLRMDDTLSVSKDGVSEQKSTNQSTGFTEAANEIAPTEVTSVLELTASKALSWLASAALPKKKSHTNTSRSKPTSLGSTNQITDSGSSSNQMTGSESLSCDLSSNVSPCKTSKVVEQKYSNLYGDAKSSTVDVDHILSSVDKLAESEISTVSSVSVSIGDDLSVAESDVGQSATEKKADLISPSMTSSVTSLMNKLFQFGGNWASRPAYKQGVTEYSFQSSEKTDDVDRDSNKSLESGSPVKLPSGSSKDSKDSKDSGDSVDSSNQVSSQARKPQLEKRSSKRVSFDIVNFFDKLLLPSPKSEKPETKAGSRWSWALGSRQAPTEQTSNLGSSGGATASAPELHQPQADMTADGNHGDSDMDPPPPKPPRLNKKENGLCLSPTTTDSGQTTPDQCAKLSPLSPDPEGPVVSYDINSNTNVA